MAMVTFSSLSSEATDPDSDTESEDVSSRPSESSPSPEPEEDYFIPPWFSTSLKPTQSSSLPTRPLQKLSGAVLTLSLMTNICSSFITPDLVTSFCHYPGLFQR